MPPEVKKALDDSEDILNRVGAFKHNVLNWNLKVVTRVGKIAVINNRGKSFIFISNMGDYYVLNSMNLFLPTKTCFKLADDLLLLAKYYEDRR